MFSGELGPKGEVLGEIPLLSYNSHGGSQLNIVWRLKASLKIKIFLPYLCRGVIITNGDLAKCNWQRSENCRFCHKMRQLSTGSLNVIFCPCGLELHTCCFKLFSTLYYLSYVWELASGVWKRGKTFSSARGGNYLLIALDIQK